MQEVTGDRVRGVLFSAVVAVSMAGAPFVPAATVTVTGAPSNDSSPAGDATATADTPGESNTATANGGAATGGGNGGHATASTSSTGAVTLISTSTANGGAATGIGSGGNAAATADTTTTGSTTSATATSVSVGANSGLFGGKAGSANASAAATGVGGTVRATSTATAGTVIRSILMSSGGTPIFATNLPVQNGFDATAAATGIATGSGAVAVSATANGGNVNYNVLDKFVGRAIGGSASLGTVYGQSDTGNVSVSATARAGGSVNNGQGIGTSVSLNNAVAGQTSGRLSFSQTAVGGNSGTFNDGGLAPVGGSASSLFSLVDTRANGLSVTLSATGGLGGNGARDAQVVANNGGNATVGGSIAANGAVSLSASATGGDGGSSDWGRAGQGGQAIIQPLVARSLNNQAVSVSVTQTGGAGGWYDPVIVAAGGGAGADASLFNIVDGVTTGALSLTQIAVGGAAGRDDFATPHAGQADNWLSKTGDFTSLNLTARATGGAGALFSSGTSFGTGGVGSAHVEGNNTKSVSTTAVATGGVGGQGSGTPGIPGGGGGNGGVADAFASATGGNDATATATATGGAGGTLFSIYDSPGTVTGDGGAANGRAVAVSSSGTSAANATIVGGAGGIQGASSSQTASGGLGGDASATAASTGNSGASVTLVVTGGRGGGIQGPTASGGHGGNAAVTSATANTVNGNAVINVTATGGAGGASFRNSPAGRGGIANVSKVSAVSVNGDATANVLAIGGAGTTGSPNPSNGGSTVLKTAVTGQSKGTLTLIQEARGGAGTIGGSAQSEWAMDNVFTKTFNLTTIATAGAGSGAAGAISRISLAETGAVVNLNAQSKAYDAGIAESRASGWGASGKVSGQSTWQASASNFRSISLNASIGATPGLRHGVTTFAASSLFAPAAPSTDILTRGTALSGTEDLSPRLADNPGTLSAPGARLGLFDVSVLGYSSSNVFNGQFSSTLSLNSAAANPFVNVGLFDGSMSNGGTITLTASVPSGASFTVTANSPAEVNALMRDNVTALKLAPTDTTLSLSGTYNRTDPNTAINLNWLITQTTTAAANARYFTGSQDAILSTAINGATNFAANPAGSINAGVPTANSDVYFSADENVRTDRFNTTLGTNVSVNSITFGTGKNALAGFTIGGPNTLTIMGKVGQYAAGSGIAMNAGSAANTINADVAIGSSQSWTNHSANALMVNGGISLSGNQLTIAGAGQTRLAGPFTSAGGLIKAGNGSLALGASAVASLLAGSSLDIRAGNVVLNYGDGSSPIATVKAILDAGLSGGFSTSQIRSTGRPAGQVIGYGDNGHGDILLRLTLPGDADLNGGVDFNDFLLLQNSFNSSNTTFAQGNFNYDGMTDFNDFLVLQNNFGQGVGGTAVTISASDIAALNAFAATVPEPTALAMLVFTVVGLRRRRLPS